jgi:hypothetical protein
MSALARIRILNSADVQRSKSDRDQTIGVRSFGDAVVEHER